MTEKTDPALFYPVVPRLACAAPLPWQQGTAHPFCFTSSSLPVVVSVAYEGVTGDGEEKMFGVSSASEMHSEKGLTSVNEGESAKQNGQASVQLLRWCSGRSISTGTVKGC